MMLKVVANTFRVDKGTYVLNIYVFAFSALRLIIVLYLINMIRFQEKFRLFFAVMEVFLKRDL